MRNTQALTFSQDAGTFSGMPLRETDARRLLRRLLAEGIFVVSPHARLEMKKDNLTDVDV